MNINITEIVCFGFIIAYFLIKEIQLFEIESVIHSDVFLGGLLHLRIIITEHQVLNISYKL